jgi:hypothetical protein
VVERLAVQSLTLLRERCMVVTQTNEQAFDLSRRLARGFPRLPFTLFVTERLAVADDLPLLANLRIARDTAALPTGPCVVVANAARWSWLRPLGPGSDAAGAAAGDDGDGTGGWGDEAAPFDLQLVDEAYQLPDYRFQQIAGLARRVVLVGDPGQIPPVVACAVERWRGNPAGPHVACPRALLARHPDVPRLALPVSRRLVPDTVRLVQPAFYPGLPFTALTASGARGLVAPLPREAPQPLDAAVDLAAGGASVVQVARPARITGEVDEELAATVVALLERLLARETRVRDDGDAPAGPGRRLTPGMVGVVCAHVAQVNAVRERLPRALVDVFVETADRFQGLERPVMVAWHPLSGRADASPFHLEAGRLCVMLSRHPVACFLVARHGIEDLLLRYAPSGDRVLGLPGDPEFEGWRAHLSVLEYLRGEGRTVTLP